MPKQQQPPKPVNDNQPVHTVRHRSLKASVWRNETERGPMYNVLVVRSYREGEEWHDSHSLGYDDLMNAAKLLYDCHSFITAERAKELQQSTGLRTQGERRS
jgi:hypothetical protein